MQAKQNNNWDDNVKELGYQAEVKTWLKTPLLFV